MSAEVLAAALKWLDAGCSVIPVRTDKTKRPLFSWTRFQKERPTPAALNLWWGENPNLGIGLVCGAVSDGLEMLELEGRATDSASLESIWEECLLYGVGNLWRQLTETGYCEVTPTGGMHLLYRIVDHEVPGNEKVARRLATSEELEQAPLDKIKVLAETRGEGGYVVVAPTLGLCHSSGQPWTTCLGSEVGKIPAITWEQRNSLHTAIHMALDQMPEPAQTPEPSRTVPAPTLGEDLRPGDQYNNEATWEEILCPLGWTKLNRPGANGEVLWARPGKSPRDGHSASTGYANDADRLYVWSSSTDFDTEVPYTKYAAFALLHHGGDYSAASRELRRQGFGSDRLPATVSTASGSLQAPLVEAGVVVPASTSVEIRGKGWGSVSVPVSEIEFMSQDDGSFANSFAKLFRNKYRASEGIGWLTWNGRTWKTDVSGRIKTAIMEYTQVMLQVSKDLEDGQELHKWVKRLRSTGKFLALSKMVAETADTKIDAEELDLPERQRWITTDNGVLDLDSKTLMPHDPDHLLTRQVNAGYDPNAQAPRFRRFMEEVLPDPEVRDYVQRAVGYTLLGRADERAMFFLHGPSGTGKTQFINTMLGIFGDFGSTAESNTFRRKEASNGPSANLHALKSRRFVSLTELDSEERFDESLLKKVTGRDAVTTRELYQRQETWVPEFAAWVATNHLPRFSSDDDAIWRRVKPIAFTRVFVDDDANTEHDLAYRMLETERDGIFAWVVEGVTMYEQRGLSEPAALREGVQEYRLDSDPAAQFLAEAEAESLIKVGEDQEINVRNLYRIYVDWSQRNMARPLGERRFGRHIESTGRFQKKRTELGSVWIGVGSGSFGILGSMFNPSHYPRT